MKNFQLQQDGLVLKTAETVQEFEDCFSLLHDAYVGNNLMTASPSGLRTTIYHALPTTTTLCAKRDGKVVGTLSLIRQSAFGFPLQAIAQLGEIRAVGGNIAEISALAVHEDHRSAGRTILFALMKLLFWQCSQVFNIRHLLMAAHPKHIRIYEGLLFFKRLSQYEVVSYDFVNGAPALGAWVDVQDADAQYAQLSDLARSKKHLYRDICQLLPPDPDSFPGTKRDWLMPTAMAPEVLDYFFNQRTQVFTQLDARKRLLLRSIYPSAQYQPILPAIDRKWERATNLRREHRHAMAGRGYFVFQSKGSPEGSWLELVELSHNGFSAQSSSPIPVQQWGDATIDYGDRQRSTLRAMAIRNDISGSCVLHSFTLCEPDLAWRKFVGALSSRGTSEALDKPEESVQIHLPLARSINSATNRDGIA